MQKAVEREDPISLAQILALLVLFNDIQKVIFQFDTEYSQQQNVKDVYVLSYLNGDFRFTLLSLEMVFLIIPLRHNLALHNLEIS